MDRILVYANLKESMYKRCRWQRRMALRCTKLPPAALLLLFFPVLSDFVSREGRMKMSSSFQMSLVIADFGFLCKP